MALHRLAFRVLTPTVVFCWRCPAKINKLEKKRMKKNICAYKISFLLWALQNQNRQMHTNDEQYAAIKKCKRIAAWAKVHSRRPGSSAVAKETVDDHFLIAVSFYSSHSQHRPSLRRSCISTHAHCNNGNKDINIMSFCSSMRSSPVSTHSYVYDVRTLYN